MYSQRLCDTTPSVRLGRCSQDRRCMARGLRSRMHFLCLMRDRRVASVFAAHCRGDGQRWQPFASPGASRRPSRSKHTPSAPYDYPEQA
jgi:hypothetical protein